MVLAKSKNAVGLGNSLMNDRFGRGKGSDQKKVSSVQRTDTRGQTYLTNEKKEAAWMKMRSVTEQPALDEFLTTAELAGTDFTAEKLNNIKIIHSDQKNPFLLSAAEERSTIKRQMGKRNRLTVPRRPPWDKTTTSEVLDERERASFLEWRRDLASLQETDDLLMTPFERNLEVWRQLWRVIERSDLVVQIVDARNPLMFWSEDLESYVKEVDPKKNNLLLVNKADMMTLAQRQAWADYFDNAKMNYKFFSAALAKAENDDVLPSDYSDDSNDDAQDDTQGAEAAEEETSEDTKPENIEDHLQDMFTVAEVEDEEDMDPRTRILTVSQLETLFLENAPYAKSESSLDARKTVIGMVGYPNVGKSSTINSLIGAKKVSVSSTPGKTKHFQTIHLSSEVILCDCPGLVFPNFATTKAELVCNGILPIDQMREFTGPAGLVAQRIPQSYFEAIYGLKVATRPLEEGGTGMPTGEEILSAYAAARGFSTTGQGQPDQSRAARHVLKDYVNGKLLFSHPPPAEPPINPRTFNQGMYDTAHLLKNRRLVAAMEASRATEAGDESSAMDDALITSSDAPLEGKKSRGLDKSFFGRGQRNGGHVKMPFNHQYTTQGQKQLTGRKLKMMTALEQGVEASDIVLANRKKHFKGNKRKNAIKVHDT